MIFATQVEGFQLAADAAEEAAGILGLEVLARLDVQPSQPSYRGRGPEDRRPEPGRRHRPGGLDRVCGADQGGGRSRPVPDVDRRDRMVRGGVHRDRWAPSRSLARSRSATRRSRPTSRPRPGTSSAAVGRPEGLHRHVTACPPYDATGQYPFSTYDLLVQTALAAGAGARTGRANRAPAMFKVGDPPGDVCYTYADCLTLIREGKDVDYEGITGPGILHHRWRQRHHPVVHPVHRRREGRRAGVPRRHLPRHPRPDQDRARSATRRIRRTTVSGRQAGAQAPSDTGQRGSFAIRRRTPSPCPSCPG